VPAISLLLSLPLSIISFPNSVDQFWTYSSTISLLYILGSFSSVLHNSFSFCILCPHSWTGFLSFYFFSSFTSLSFWFYPTFFSSRLPATSSIVSAVHPLLYHLYAPHSGLAGSNSWTTHALAGCTLQPAFPLPALPPRVLPHCILPLHLCLAHHFPTPHTHRLPHHTPHTLPTTFSLHLALPPAHHHPSHHTACHLPHAFLPATSPAYSTAILPATTLAHFLTHSSFISFTTPLHLHTTTHLPLPLCFSHVPRCTSALARTHGNLKTAVTPASLAHFLVHLWACHTVLCLPYHLVHGSL